MLVERGRSPAGRSSGVALAGAENRLASPSSALYLRRSGGSTMPPRPAPLPLKPAAPVL